MATTLIHKFNRGDVLTNNELLKLEKEMLYYSGNTMPPNSWFHQTLSTTELCLMKKGAYTVLNSVQDILNARGVSK